jgi:hypothetical protein
MDGQNIPLKLIVDELRCEGVDWFLLAQDRELLHILLNTPTNLQGPQTSGNALTACGIGAFSILITLYANSKH